MNSSHEGLYQTKNLPPIPELEPQDGWKEVPIAESDLSHEPLVPVGIFSDYRRVFSSSAYADEHFNSPYTGGLEGSNIAVFMRKGVADKLEKAAEKLPYGHHIMVMDAYRTLEVQDALYKQYEEGLIAIHPNWSPDEISAETQKYVSVPSSDASRPSPHNTGASVDLVIIKVEDETQKEIDIIDQELDSLSEDEWQQEYTLEMNRSELIRRNGRVLNFGTRFDYGGPEAALRHYEEKAENVPLSPDEIEAKMNRRLLFNLMKEVGLEPYADEWWHFNDPASQMGAKVSGREHAEYGPVEMSEENIEFAEMREFHHRRTDLLSAGIEWKPPGGLGAHYIVAKVAADKNSPKDLQMIDTIDKIEPPKLKDVIAA